MKKEEYRFGFEVYDSINDLTQEDQALLDAARNVTEIAYAPYSKFLVGAVAKLNNGESVSGTNQENASYPVGICAERSLLATASTLHSNVPIETMAVAYHNLNGESDRPVSPCGMCRQSILEYETLQNEPIEILLHSTSGSVTSISSASALLPLHFDNKSLSCCSLHI
jgi:cytidine deaminase